AGNAISEVEKYGELELVMEEDFSLLTAGSEEEPARKVNLVLDNPEYPWWNFDPKYTHLPHWGTGGEGLAVACPAGGCLYLEAADNSPYAPHQAHVNTTLVKVDNYDRTAVLEFRARTKNDGETYDGLYVEMGETNNMGPTWHIPEDPAIITGIPSEWTTYRIMFRDAGPTTLFNITAMMPGNVFIDDIKVYQLKPFVERPEVFAHSEYKGSSFVANWSAVEGADSYLVSMYRQVEIPVLPDENNPMGSSTIENEYVFTDVKVSDNHYTVTGVESGETYYYTVKAVKGENVSLESFVCRVYDLEAPVMNAPEIIDGWTYTAGWNPVPGADVYNYFAYDKRVAEADGEFVVTFEDFTGVKDLEGFETGFTIDSPADLVYPEYYCRELNQRGWRATNACPYTDFICIDAYHYLYNNEQSGFISPEFDMSKNGGKFTVEADLAAKLCRVWFDDDSYEDRYAQPCVAVFNWNDARGDYDQVELVYPEQGNTVNDQWKHFTFNLTKGTERTVFGLFAVYAPDNLYIDNFKVTQNYKEGESLMEPFLFKQYHGSFDGDNPTSIDVEVPERVQGWDIYHSVSSFGRQPDKYGQSYDDRESAYSPLEFVMTSKSGVENIAVDAADADAEYFRIDGIRVAADRLTPGVYVVRKGNEVSKVVIK
ncbi:MAG: hypothetical protein K2L80_01710, partial [Muribaculaceae bacterium]|nr:hypothetical protein [Muribaculaceae bacterium]